MLVFPSQRSGVGKDVQISKSGSSVSIMHAYVGKMIDGVKVWLQIVKLVFNKFRILIDWILFNLA